MRSYAHKEARATKATGPIIFRIISFTDEGYSYIL